MIEKIKKKLKTQDNEFRQFLTELAFESEFDFFKNRTLPAMLENRFAPAYGWSQDFRTVKEYNHFIDELYGEEGFAERTVINLIAKHLPDFLSKEEVLDVFTEVLSSGDKSIIRDTAWEIYQNMSLQEVIDILSNIVEKDLKSGKIDEKVYEFFLSCYSDFSFDSVMELEENPEEIIRLAEKFGKYRKLQEVVN